MKKLVLSILALIPSLCAAQQTIAPFQTSYGNFTQGIQFQGSFGILGQCWISTGTGNQWGSCPGGLAGVAPDGLSPAGIIVSGRVAAQSALFSLGATAQFFAPSTVAGANQSLQNFTAFSNLTSGFDIVGDSTWYMDNAHGATDFTLTAGYKVASALNMPLSQNVAIPGAGAADCFPFMITPNNISPGPGYGTVPSGQGWSILSLGINNWGVGTGTNPTQTYSSMMLACGEWLGIARKYKVMATDPVVGGIGSVLAGGFASNANLINGGAIATANGATDTITIATTGNALHLLYGVFVPGAVISANYVSGGSVTGTAGQGCFVNTFNNSSTVAATVVLTGTNSLAGAALAFHLGGAGGTGATAAPTTAVLSSGSATCSGTITISSLLGLGGPAGAPVAQASVTIDGSTPGVNPTLFGQAVGGFNFSSIINQNGVNGPGVSSIMDATYPVTAGTHTIVVTTQNTSPFVIGGSLSQGALGQNPPAVAIGGVLHQNLCASDSGTAAYDTLNQTLATTLQADGIIAPYINDRAAVGCNVSDGTVGNAGMSGNPTTMPDGTVSLGSTSVGAHPNNVGYELRAQAFKQGMLMTGQATQGTNFYSSVQADSHAQPVQTSLVNLGWTMPAHCLSFVNSCAWPLFSGYNHVNNAGVAGILPWHVYFDGNNSVWNFSTSPIVNALNGTTPQAGKEVSITDQIGFRITGLTNGKQTLYMMGNGSGTEYRIPAVGTQELIPLFVDSHPAFAASLAFNMAFSLNTTALTGNVATMTFNYPYATTLGGEYSVIGFCNGASPFTVAAPANFDVTRNGYQWPFANTANFDTTTSTCIEDEVYYNSAQSAWQTMPYANVLRANTFTKQQTMPAPKITGVGCNSPTTYATTDGSACNTLPLPLKITNSITPAAVTASQCNEQTFTYTGLLTTQQVSVSPPAALGIHIWISYARASAGNTLAISFCGDATSGTPPSGNYIAVAY